MANTLEQKLGFDVTQATDAVNKINSALKQYGLTIDNITSGTERYDNTSKKTILTVTALNAKHQEFNITLSKDNTKFWKKTADAAEDSSKRIVESINKIEKAEVASIRRREQIQESYRNQDQRFANERITKQKEEENAEVRSLTQREKARVFYAELDARREATRLVNYQRSQAIYNAAVKQVIGAPTATTPNYSDQINKFQYSMADQLTQQHVAVQKDALTKVVKDHQEATNRITLTWQSMFRLLEIQILHRFIATLSSAFRQSIQDATEYGVRLAEIQTITSGAANSTQEWSTELVKLSNAYNIDLLDMTRGAYEAISNQIVKSTEDTLFLRKAAELATVGVGTMQNAVDAMSSIQNAFNMKVTDSGHIAAVLFKVIELGRVRLDEMGSNLGRISLMSKMANVSFEDMGASIATVTIQGIRTDTTLTLLTNLIQKMIKPSKEMTQTFKDLGYASGPEMFQVKGVLGALNEIIEHAHNTKQELVLLGDEFKNIRAIQAGAALRTGAEQYGVTRASFDSGIAEAAMARGVEKIKESPAWQWRQEMNEMKNYFTTIWGVDLVKTLNDVSKSFGGLKEVFKMVISTATALGGVFLATKLRLLDLSGITSKAQLIAKAYTLEITRQRITQEALAYSARLAAADSKMILASGPIAANANVVINSLGKVKAAVMGLKAAFTGLASMGPQLVIFATIEAFMWLSREGERTRETIEKNRVEFEKISNLRLDKFIVDLDKMYKIIEEGHKQTFNSAITLMRGMRVFTSTWGGQLEEENKVLEKGVKALFDSMLKETETATKKLEAAINQSISRLERIRERLFTSQMTGADKQFMAEISKQKPEDQLQAIKRRAEEAHQESLRLLKETGEMLPGETQEKYNERLKQKERESEEYDKRAEKFQSEYERRVQEQNKGMETTDVKAQKARETLQQRLNDLDEKAQTTRWTKASWANYQRQKDKLERELAKPIVKGKKEEDLGIDTREKWRKERETADKELQKNIGLMKQQAEQAHKTQEALTKLWSEQSRIFTEVDKAKPEAIKQMQDAVAKLQAGAKGLGVNLTPQAEELNRYIKMIALKQKQIELEKQLQEAATAREVAQKRVNDLAVQEKELKGTIKVAQEKYSTDVGHSIDKIIKFAPHIKASFGSDETIQLFRMFRSEIKEITSLRNELLLHPENEVVIQQIREKMLIITGMIGKMESLKFTTGAMDKNERGQFIFDTDQTNIFDILRQEQTLREKIQEPQKELVPVQKQMAELKVAMVQYTQSINDNIQALGRHNIVINDTADGITDITGVLKTSNEELTRSVDMLLQADKAIRSYIKSIGNVPTHLSIQNTLTPPIERAMGGYLARGGFPGGPRGTDRIPVWLSHGEYVLDAVSARTWIPIMQSMRQMSGISNNSRVTNVGDINISVNGGNTSQATVRDIAGQLRREIRRGTLSLN